LGGQPGPGICFEEECVEGVEIHAAHEVQDEEGGERQDEFFPEAEAHALAESLDEKPQDYSDYF